MEQFVLDSYAVLSYLNDEPAAQDVEDILRSVRDMQIAVYMSWINLGEVYYRLQRVYNRQIARQAVEIIKAWPIKLMQAEEQVTMMAGDIKARYRLSYADAFAAATTVNTRGILLTGDPEFKPLENHIIKIKWLKPNH
ncbi:MAG: PIN domain protein [Pelotomaculum sp. PtaB.Bin013]|uniref:Type II toxin-antitoxin system VapC family toxin n=1 Tax=Pelotomaculum isophthalicicum JI TaxID=947010 RepID=A0A9X4H232_9FIRM|nr:type II toxin-antitoxin system VapC family toxin [Pelotomaculum isophthalicicum]MDF9408041.1 type II toxin-antitoxin system VapC family toxin [Pelotomaculum isophthalicicum JI]OPX80868.1 MAG: PIN domain protein [Pelotomaculum sp. PtaB.Bin013]